MPEPKTFYKNTHLRCGECGEGLAAEKKKQLIDRAGKRVERVVKNLFCTGCGKVYATNIKTFKMKELSAIATK